MSGTWLKAVFPCTHTPGSTPRTLPVRQLPTAFLADRTAVSQAQLQARQIGSNTKKGLGRR